MLGFVLSLLIALQGTPEATPEAEPPYTEELANAVVYAGQEALAAREFLAADDAESETGILLIQVSVRVFGSSDEAVDALAESAAAHLASDDFAGLEEQDEADFGDESTVYSGELANGGFVGIVIVADENALHRYIAAGLEEDPLPELLEEAEVWIDAAAEADDAAEPLDLLPDEDDVPDGFVLTEEGSVTSDGEARPATPTA